MRQSPIARPLPSPRWLAGCALLLSAATVRAQDILFYRFESAYGVHVVNCAPGSPAPAQGSIVSSLPGAPAASWAPGRFGAALAGGIASPIQPNRVDTGWVPGSVTGSVSYAMWVRLAYNQPAPGLCYLFGSPTSGMFRTFLGTSGVLFTGGLGYSSQATAANVYQLASQGWVHVAYVADATTMMSTYYVNGVPEVPRSIATVPTWTSAVPFTVGQQLTTSAGSIFDIDEFLLTQRVLTPAEVLVLANAPRAGDGAYGGGCGSMTLSSAGGAPTLGNAGYRLLVTAGSPLFFALGFGSNRARFGGSPLPFDLGGALGLGPCALDSSFDLGSVTGTAGPQPTVVPLPIPTTASLIGVTLHAQAPGVGGAAPFEMSNAFAIGIGN